MLPRPAWPAPPRRPSPVRRARTTVPSVSLPNPGVLFGNVIQIPIDVNANVCGNTINVIDLLNPVFGNECQIKD